VTVPLALVVPVVELSVPHAAAGAPEVLKNTGSLETATAAVFFTVAVTVEVVLPLAEIVFGLAATVTT